MSTEDKDKTVTLTSREIFDLAKAAQLIPWEANFEATKLSDEDAETEYVIVQREGGLMITDDDGVIRLYRRGAYLDEYPEEGSFPLGDEITMESQL